MDLPFLPLLFIFNNEWPKLISYTRRIAQEICIEKMILDFGVGSSQLHYFLPIYMNKGTWQCQDQLNSRRNLGPMWGNANLGIALMRSK